MIHIQKKQLLLLQRTLRCPYQSIPHILSTILTDTRSLVRAPYQIILDIALNSSLHQSTGECMYSGLHDASRCRGILSSTWPVVGFTMTHSHAMRQDMRMNLVLMQNLLHAKVLHLRRGTIHKEQYLTVHGHKSVSSFEGLVPQMNLQKAWNHKKNKAYLVKCSILHFSTSSTSYSRCLQMSQDQSYNSGKQTRYKAVSCSTYYCYDQVTLSHWRNSLLAISAGASTSRLAREVVVASRVPAV